MAVHVTIHDVSPAFEREIDLALEATHAYGVKPALLVVPNFHGKWPLLDHPAFCEKLRALQAEGHEMYLHGFFHEARAQGSETRGTGRPSGLRWLFAQRVASGGEAEFSDVTREEAEERLSEGERVLADCGLRITGFVPPAWSMPPWLLPMLGMRGYTFTEDHLRVYDPAHKQSRTSIVLNWASRTPTRLLTSAVWCRIAKHGRPIFPARIAIHPGDMTRALLRHEVREMLAWGEGDWVPRGQALFSS